MYKRLFLHAIIFIAHLMTFIQMGLGLGLRLGDIRESWETGDSNEEEDTQWRHTKNIC